MALPGRNPSLQRNFLRLPAPAADGAGDQEGGGPAVAPLLVQAILNPLSKPAQRLAPLLRFLHSALGAEAQLLLNPQARPAGVAGTWDLQLAAMPLASQPRRAVAWPSSAGCGLTWRNAACTCA